MDTLKVLVVDDSLAFQSSLGRLLGGVPGVEIVGYAEDVAGAMGLIQSRRPDVLVLDVELKGHDHGMAVLRHVVASYPRIKVMALSNFHWIAMRKGFMQAGASAYFDKSMEFNQARDWIAALAPHPHPEHALDVEQLM